MININDLLNIIKKNKINFFSGVPDSVLKELSKKIEHEKNHIIAPNEGSAISLGIGNYLSTQNVPCIYMQNSGLSNAINPLISIAHKSVYSIPLILIIGWRGSPNSNDEPQHIAKGKITKKILQLLNIRYSILKNKSDLLKFDKLIKHSKKNKSIVACLIEQNILIGEKKKFIKKDTYFLDKEKFLTKLLELIPLKSKIISSTGYNSRELIYIRKKLKKYNSQDFYMVGGMGHTMSVALGYSLTSKNKTICIDGDGSLLMHLGGIKTVADFAKNNFKYILINNNAHDSVGGQFTHSENIDFNKLSKSLGFKKFYSIIKESDLNKYLKKFIYDDKLSFMEVKVCTNKLKNLPRPSDLIDLKNKFMR
jgi:phosphonopyruvate decarboxylase